MVKYIVTRKAVDLIVGKGTVSRSFRNDLLSDLVTPDRLKLLAPDLDEQDLGAIMAAMLATANMPSFSKQVAAYADNRYK
ncbi:hypothetical protein HZB78_03895 [Candidatus Collierbacteria bacterium]|nr:hypothetical protein [Candidatus Collierbacteria bacterium]